MNIDNLLEKLGYNVSQIKTMGDGDPYLMNSLWRSKVDGPTIFSLIWGVGMVIDERFPSELRKIIADILLEMLRKEESCDPWDIKLHSIKIDLMYLLYEKQVNSMIEKVVVV